MLHRGSLLVYWTLVRLSASVGAGGTGFGVAREKSSSLGALERTERAGFRSLTRGRLPSKSR
jgi:hypothetical protein